jgi:hypothetical protein
MVASVLLFVAARADGDGRLPGDAWAERARAPVPLTEIGAAVWEGEIWTVGGLTAFVGEFPQDVPLVQIYDPIADAWREGPPLPVPVHHTAVVATDTDLVVIGGFRRLIPFDSRDEVWILDPDHDSWVPGPPLPEPRGAGAAAWDGSRIVYGGGLGPGQTLSSEVWALEPLAAEWQQIGDLSVARDHLAAASNGNGITWFLGGRLVTLASNLGTVDILVGNDLRFLGELPTPRGGVAAFHVPHLGACVAGGEEFSSNFIGTFGEVECINAGGRVTELPSLGRPRHGLGAGVVDGIAYVLLGGPRPFLSATGIVEALEVGPGRRAPVPLRPGRGLGR